MAPPTFDSTMWGRAQPATLVSVAWVLARQADSLIRLVVVDEDPPRAGRIVGAVQLDWRRELQDPTRRDIVRRGDFEGLMSRHGIANDSVVVLSGDGGNVSAAYAFWLLALHGHRQLRLLDGGRDAWERAGYPWSRESAPPPLTTYRAPAPNLAIRAFRDEVFRQMEAGRPLLDVRTEAEYRGEVGTAQRGGHIPGAVNIPWDRTLREDGTFRDVAELRALYGMERGEEIIAYSGAGCRSSHTWFVLKHLLGYPHVKNYDGGWAEWGNLVGAPIETEGSRPPLGARDPSRHRRE